MEERMSETTIETIRGALSEHAEAVATLLRQQLAEIEAAYQREAEPILKRLAELEAMRPTYYYLSPAALQPTPPQPIDGGE
jgi:hypothetical protein